MAFDLQLFFFLNDLAGRSRLPDLLIVFCAEYLPYVVLATLFVFLWRSGRERIKMFAFGILSSVVAGGIVTVIRHFYHRPRPFVSYQVHQLIADSNYSFPSRHAAFFFALAAALYFYDKRLGAAFFIGAAIIGIARVMAGVHYPSDILGGMVIGIATAYLLVAFIKTTG